MYSSSTHLEKIFQHFMVSIYTQYFSVIIILAPISSKNNSREVTFNIDFIHNYVFLLIAPLLDPYSEPSQTSEMELFAKLVKGFLRLTVFAKSYILDIWLGFEDACVLADKGDDKGVWKNFLEFSKIFNFFC